MNDELSDTQRLDMVLQLMGAAQIRGADAEVFLQLKAWLRRLVADREMSGATSSKMLRSVNPEE